MSRNEAPPFGRGETFYGVNPNPAIDASNLGGAQHEGKEWVFEDIDFTPGNVGAKAARTNRSVRCRCVRNVSGINLLPKRLAHFYASGVNYGAQVDGYAFTTAGRGYPIDEFLPAAGVANNDLFWIVIDGPAMCLTPIAPGDFNETSFAVGDILVALTAATSQATTAGHVSFMNLTGSTTDPDTTIFNAAVNYIGHCLSAVTSGQTNSNVLIEVGHW